MNPRVRLALSTVATVVALALVIFGLWAFTAPKSQPSTPPTIHLSPAQLSAQAYQDGMKALSNEQTGTAAAYFQKALQLDPSNSSAKAALEKTKSSSSGGSTNTTSTPAKKSTPTPAPPNVWTTKLDVKALLPSSVPGYSLGRAEKGSATAANVSATPSDSSSSITTVEWSVFDQGSASKAAAFVKNVSKKLYPQGGSQVQVNDVTGYFGANSGGIGTVEFVRGRYVFEVLMTSRSPLNDKDSAVQAAEAFPVKP
jgi:hypothetical protein